MEEHNEPKIIVYGTYNDIHGNNFYGGNNYFADMGKKKQESASKKDINEYTIEELREIVNKVMPMVGDKYSRFFSVIKVLMWRGRIPDHDFKQGVALINELYPQWELESAEQYAIAKYDVQSFYKSFDKWTPDDAPVKGKSYQTYHDIAEELLKLL